MTRLICISFILISLISQDLFSQTKQLSIDDAVVGLYRNLAPDRISGIQWRPGSEEYSFMKSGGLWVHNVSSGTEEVLLTVGELNKQLNKTGTDSLRSFPAIEWISNNRIRFYAGSSIVYFDLDKQKVAFHFKYPEGAENFDISPSHNYLAYTLGNNLNIKNTKQIEIAVSNERNLEMVFGTTVHRNEFGISKGTFWSPSGKLLAFYRKDESKVSDYPLVDVTKRVASLENIKYPMAGMDSEEVSIGIYNTDTKQTVYLETGKPADQYLTNIAWRPDEKIIYVAVLNREQNHMKFNAYNAENGKFLKTLFEERHTKYVEPLHPALFVPQNNEQFVWQSRRDGFNHLYLYDVSGNLITQLTKGNWEVTDVYGFSADGKYIYIQANKESPIDFDIYKLDIESAKLNRISKEQGVHNALVHSDSGMIIDIFSNSETPSKYELFDNTGKHLHTLLESGNPLSEYKLGEMTIGTIKAADGNTDLFYRLILPPDFDKNKKYPAIVYVYGGPHAQLVTNRWMGGAAGWDYYMAQQGYVMFTLDNRGSANRGLEFENVIHRNLGSIETEDQLCGIEFLRKQGFVDMERIGVHGWSYGGFMTINMMTEHSDIFKVGVAGGPVIDWKYYEVMYGERYMDMPVENPMGYERSSLLNKASNLKGRLLVVHGAIDNVVVWQHSLDFLHACIEQKVLVDYFVYPRHEHNVRGYDRIHLMRMVTRYFDDHLK